MGREEAERKATGLFNNVKSKLGFKSANQSEDTYQEYDDGYDSAYDDGYYDDDAYYDNRNDDSYSYSDEPRNDYSEYADTYGTSSDIPRGVSTPPLVSIDDVRRHTDMRRSNETYQPAHARQERVDGYVPQAVSTPSEIHSKGLNSLFDSTQQESASSMQQQNAGGVLGVAQPEVSGTNYVSAAATVNNPDTGDVAIIAPRSYDDAELIIKALKASGLVALSLRFTPAELRFRIRDFCYGAAAMCGATVEALNNDAIVVSVHGALTAPQQATLRQRGLM